MKLRYFLMLIIITVCVIWLGCSVNPVTGKRELSFLSEAREISIGQEMYPQYTQQSFGLFNDRELQAYINSIGQKLASSSDRPALDYEFNIVNHSMLNAYALPGGKISITRGLLSKMSNESQLAGVLGHEVGHVAAKHTVKSYTRSIMANVAIALGSYYLNKKDVKYKELYTIGGLLATNLLFMKYSRDQERQADELGMKYMVNTNYDPEGFVQSMKILRNASKKEPNKIEIMFQSHPLTSERIKTAKERVNSRYFNNRNNNFGEKKFQKENRYLKSVVPAYEYFDTGVELLAKKRYTEARTFLQTASNKAPNESIILTFLAKSQEETGQVGKARGNIDRALKIYPEEYHTRLVSGSINRKLGDYKKSMYDLNVAETLLPGQAGTHFLMGKNYEDIGDRKNAAGYYMKVLQAVDSGEMADYCKKKLKEWDYITEQKTE